MIPYFTILRPINCLMAVLAVYVASLIAGQPFIPALPVIYALVSVFLVCAGGMVINDYFDIEIDRVNKPARPIPAGKISPRNALGLSCLLFAVGFFASYQINIFTFAVAIAASALLALYAWKLKKVMLVGHLTVSSLVALTFVYGGLINLNVVPALSLAILALLANTGREIYKSIEDILGDEKAGLQTLPIKYGVIRAKIIASLFVIFI
jgi:geranylgeranylglycerol-phosphate geranylgeranyltransferase